MKNISFSAYHECYTLKETVKSYLQEKGFEVIDFGTNSPDSCDYADFGHPAAKAVESGECDLGVGMCGSGQGMQITLNKHQGIRAALCWLPEIAALARQHNDANFLVLPARFISEEEAYKIVDTFLASEFEGGRHSRRVAKIPVEGEIL